MRGGIEVGDARSRHRSESHISTFRQYRVLSVSSVWRDVLQTLANHAEQHADGVTL
jgi:hypothetical protein